MGRLVVLAVLSAAVAAGLWASCRSIFASPVVARRNYRDLEVPVGVGVLIVLAAIVVQAASAVAGSLDVTLYTAGSAVDAVAVASLGFCLLGLIDDLLAQGDDRGFRGHLRAMARGRLTTGGLKLAGGGVLAAAVVGGVGVEDFARLVLGALVVALAANLGNLFDRAPGRTTKVALAALVVLVAASSAPDRVLLQPVVVVVAAAVGLGWFDLREQLMLGDAGANVLGAVLGLGLVMTSGTVVQVVAVVALLGANLASERWSFSRAIAATPPLRWLDRLGRA